MEELSGFARACHGYAIDELKETCSILKYCSITARYEQILKTRAFRDAANNHSYALYKAVAEKLGAETAVQISTRV